MKGTVIKRGNKWSVVVDIGRDENGKRIRKWHSGFDTKREAEAARIEIVHKLQQGNYVPPTRQTVREWLTTWLEGRQNLADTTRDGYRREVDRICEVLGPHRLKDLTPALIASFYRDLDLAPKTIKNCHGVLHKAFEDAVRQGVLPRNPSDHVELPRAERKEMEAWTADELSRFLRHVAEHRLGAAWRLMCGTGMRRSELLGMRWPNVDLDAGSVTVVDTVVPVSNKAVLRIGETKSRRSRRRIAIGPDTVAALKSHKAKQAAEALKAGSAWSNSHELVFTDELGRIVSPDWFTRATKRFAKEAGVPALPPHAAARHTYATLALQNGTPAKVVQERLGHSSISITLDRYSHLVEGMDREAAEMLEEMIR